MATEKRLIDANALLEKIQFRMAIDNKNAEIIAGCVDITRRLIENAPTVDAVEVVRCKDCKHWCDSWVAPDGKHTHGECHMEDADDVIVGRWGDDFCSYGERRTHE